MPSWEGFYLLVWAQQECVCGTRWQRHALATACLCYVSYIGHFYLPPVL